MGDLLFVPQTYSIGTLHIQHPSSSATDFEVVRNSVATYIGKDGLVHNALPNQPRIDFSHLAYDDTKPRTSTNLYTYSRDLTNSDWTKSNVNANTNEEDPFGTSKGSVLNETTDLSQHSFSRNGNVIIGRKHTVSCYFKMMGRRYVLIAPNNGGVLSVNAWFDLQDGVVVSNPQGTASISDEGNGWYRCSIHNIAESTGVIRLNFFLSDQPINSARTYQGDITKGLRADSFQLEEGDLSPAITTENELVTRYRPLIDGLGRVLTEIESTNLFYHSEIKGNNFKVGYGTSNITYSDNVKCSFGGFNQSMNIEIGSFTNSFARAAMLVDAVNGEHKWISVRIKKISGQYLEIVHGNAVSALSIELNLETGEIINSTGSAVGYVIVREVDNYLELMFRVVFSSTTIAGLVYFGFYDNPSFLNYDSSGVSIEVTGLQNEANVDFPSSYIPTNGAPVTRGIDEIDNGGNSSIFNHLEGTLFFEFSLLENSTGDFSWSLSSGEDTRIYLTYNGSSNALEVSTRSGGVNGGSVSVIQAPVDNSLKVLVTYQESTNKLKLWANGIPSGEDDLNVAFIPGAFTNIRNSSGGSSSRSVCAISKIRYFDRVLMNEECSIL